MSRSLPSHTNSRNTEMTSLRGNYNKWQPASGSHIRTIPSVRRTMPLPKPTFPRRPPVTPARPHTKHISYSKSSNDMNSHNHTNSLTPALSQGSAHSAGSDDDDDDDLSFSSTRSNSVEDMSAGPRTENTSVLSLSVIEA